MSEAAQLLTHLVSDLIRAEVGATRAFDPDLLSKFKNDPEKVMADYGLGEEAGAALFTMDRQFIAEFMLKEILATPAPPADGLWSDPIPRIESVEPNVLVAGPAQVLKLDADCVMSTAEVHLVSIRSFNHIVARPNFNPSPPKLTDEKLSITFDLTGASSGDYKVQIYNTPSSSPMVADEVVTIKE